jgi:hypothetical protein
MLGVEKHYDDRDFVPCLPHAQRDAAHGAERYPSARRAHDAPLWLRGDPADGPCPGARGGTGTDGLRRILPAERSGGTRPRTFIGRVAAGRTEGRSWESAQRSR